MRFLVHKRRNAPAVIIVALIDVLIVLVIFLLVTTTFKQQAALKLTLPESSQAKKQGTSENPPLVLNVNAEGLYSFDDNVTKTADQVREEILAKVAQNPQLVLAINADEKAPWGKLVKIRDIAAEAKIKSLVAFTKEGKK
jgi:biopolymer transport protein ExbD